MKKMNENGAYVAPSCEIVAINAERGLCLSGGGTATHEGMEEEDYVW
ncbi:MAG: hypothetical protein MR292_05115 [Alistipes sp.]|nr:hypothetical protein [Alistipes sp.]